MIVPKLYKIILVFDANSSYFYCSKHKKPCEKEKYRNADE